MRPAGQLPNPYEEVALLSAEGDYQWTNEEHIYQRLRTAAAKLGANAVVLDSMTEPSTGRKVAQAILGTTAPRKGKAIAVYVRSGDTVDRKGELTRPAKQ